MKALTNRGPRVCLAQQEAQRAQFYVEKAKQDQRQKIIQAEGEAEAAKMVTVGTSAHMVQIVGVHLPAV